MKFAAATISIGGDFMKKELTISVIILSLLVIIFIFGVKITENNNNKSLMENYTYSMQIKGDSSAVIAPPTQKAIQYHNKRVNLWIMGIVMSFLIPIVFLFSGLSGFIRSWCLSKSKSLFIVFFLYFVVYSLITALISVPLDYYGSFTLKHAYGLSNQSVSKWIIDFFKSFTISTLVGACFIYIPYLIIKKSPTHWWLNLGILSIPIIIFITFISPMYIDPLFNKYEKVNDTKLEAKIYDQLHKTSIENCKVYQVNKSVDTKEMNAYMTGVFNTKRIVLWDTTIKSLTERETLCLQSALFLS